MSTQFQHFLYLLLLVILFATSGHAFSSVTKPEPVLDNLPPEGFVALFNGKDLTGWKGLVGDPVKRARMVADELAQAQIKADQRMEKHWHTEDGALVFNGKGESLATGKDYRDFELYLDWKIEPGGDSGIYLRGSPQVQIWDHTEGSGGLYNNKKNPSKPLVFADNPPGQWNRFHIIMKGEVVTVYLNEKLVVDCTPLENYWEREKPIYESGQIELQSHGSTLYFKNIYLRELPPETTASPMSEKDKRMAWWRDAKFGMFIHWGLYAIPAGLWKGEPVPGIGEWIMHYRGIPPNEYEQLAKAFNPVFFDGGAWARLAKSAGMKYLVITTKHHDGFCLFESDHTKYDVMDATFFRRDIMKELSGACRKEGIRIGWYHSILDWHHPDGRGETFSAYRKVLHSQVEELLTRYGEIAMMWFDGEWIKEWTEEQGKALYGHCRSLQPQVIVNNRVGKGRQGMAGLSKSPESAGDFGTPEQQIPATGLPGVDWETCMTMNDTWGFKATDHNWKSAETLIRMLVDAASKGGNFLLNVGPTALGEVPDPSIERLEAMGRWLETNGESIYGTEASPFPHLPWGRCTRKSGTLYLHIFHWPEEGLLRVPGLYNELTGARFLSDKKAGELRITRDGSYVLIQLPKKPLNAIDTVLRLDIAGEPAVLNLKSEAAAPNE